jgi:transcriptional regulator with XRE-family HTH domain
LERPFAELLTNHRGGASLTQEELAARAGLSVSAISLLERGARTAPRARTVARLADALNLDAADRQEFASAARRRPARERRLATVALLHGPDRAMRTA